MPIPYPDQTWPDRADMIDDDGNGRTPSDIDGLGNDLPTWMAAVGDSFEGIPDTVASEVSNEISEHVLGVSNPHPATAITVTASGNITSANVQGALEQLDAASAGAAALSNHLNDATDAHNASAIAFSGGGMDATDVASAIGELDSEKADSDHTHTLDSLSDVDTTGAINGKILKHNGTSWVIGDDQTGGGGSPVNIGDLGDVDTTGATDGKGLVYGSGSWTPVDVATQTELDAHTADTSDAHDASAISFAATGGIAATDAQAAIVEVDSEAAKKAANLSDLASPATARTNLGLGTIATQAFSAVTITGGSISGIGDLAVADGGTGASTAAAARTNLGVADVAHSHTLDGLSDVDTTGAATGNALTYNGASWVPGTGSGGGGGRTIRAVTAAGAVAALTTDDVLVVDPGGVPRVVNLPSLAAAITANTVLTVVKNSSNPNVYLTLDGNGSEPILDALTAVLLAPYETLTLIPTTARWLVI